MQRAEIHTSDRQLRRIAIVMNALHGGGAEFVGRTWATSLAASGHEVTLVLLQSPPVEQDYVDLTGVSVVDLGGSSAILKVRALRSIVSRRQHDAVVSLQMFANLLCLLAATVTPRKSQAGVLVSERNIVTIRSSKPSTSHRLKVALAKRLYRRADVLVAISHPVAAEMIAGFGVRSERVRVVPNPAAAKGLAGSESPRPVSTYDVDLVMVNRLSAQKRPTLTVDVARILNSRGISTRIVIFGTGELETQVRAEASRAAVDLEFRGWVERWPAACADNSVLLLPSMKEGFGNVLVEAAAHRIPSVAISEALGVADAIVPGITGELAADGSPETLADAVEHARSCRFEGLDRWLSRFSVENSTAVLLGAITAATRGR